MAFTVIFNDNGTIFQVRDQNGNIVNRCTKTLDQELQGKTVVNVITTEIIITDPVDGKIDPCIKQGSQLYCW